MSDLNNAQLAFNNAVTLYKDNSPYASIEQLEEILKIYPQHKESLELLLQINIKVNHPLEALKYVNKLLESDNKNKIYLETKYKLLIYVGDSNLAFDCLTILHKEHPTINTVRELSNNLIDKDENESSEEIIQKFFESNKEYSELYQGIRHVKANRLQLAEKAYKKVLKKDNNNVDALRLLGLLAFKKNNFKIAEELFIRAIKINPNFKLLWENLAKCYRLQNKLDHAKKAFKNLLRLDPHNFEALGALGTIYIRLGDYAEGIKIYKNLLNQNDNNPRLYLSMGHALKTIGQREDCENAYHKAIEYFPASGEGYWSLANLKTYSFSDKQIASMEKSLDKEIHLQEKIQMMFALGKAFESKKEFTKSFSYYKEGNWLQRKNLDYNAQENSESIQRVIDFFSKHKEDINFNSGHNNSDPIFILGLPRAGSTLIEQILSSHSLIEGTQEHPNIMSIGRNIRTKYNTENFVDNLLDLKQEEIEYYGKKYINDTKWSRNEHNHFIDKMPNNFPYIGLIKMILPKAKIIDARRDPIDGCFSCFKQYFAKGQHFTYDLDDIARYYKDYLKIMAFWNDYFQGDIYTINYENVIENTEKEVKNLFDFLEINFEESCLNFHKSKRPVKTASSEQVRQPIYKSGIKYWKNFDDHLEELKKHFPDYAK